MERSSRACSGAPSGRTSSRSSWRASSRRRWTTTATSRSRASTCRTSTPSTSRRPTATSSRATRTRSSPSSRSTSPSTRSARATSLLTPARVLFETDDDLGVGEFGIATAVVQPRRGAARTRRRPSRRTPGATMVYKPRTQPTEQASLEELGVAQRVGRARRWTGSGSAVDKRRVVLGRSQRLRRPARRPERLAPPRRARPGGAALLARRPRLDERRRGRRPARPAREARGRRRASRSARPRSSSRPSARMTGSWPSTALRSRVLLALKIAFLVLLYLFIWRIVRSAARDLRLPHASDDPAPAAGRRGGLGAADRRATPGRGSSSSASPMPRAGRRVRASTRRRSRSAAAARTTSSLDGDEFASARHARFEPRARRRLGRGLGSTNGTFVNGEPARARAAARARRRRPRRRDRPEVRANEPTRSAVGVASAYAVQRHRPQAAAQRGLLRRRDPPLFAVADGMGGAQAGEVASKLAAAALAARATARPLPASRAGRGADPGGEPARLRARRRPTPSASGMGTTMTVALVEGTTRSRSATSATRAPTSLRGGRLEQLTDDHSLVERAGEERRALARGGRGASAALGDHARASAPTRTSTSTRSPSRREDGDVFLLCSDGLTDMVDDADDPRAASCATATTSTAATRALVAAANRGGGEDNITAVAFEHRRGRTPRTRP